MDLSNISTLSLFITIFLFLVWGFISLLMYTILLYKKAYTKTHKNYSNIETTIELNLNSKKPDI